MIKSENTHPSYGQSPYVQLICTHAHVACCSRRAAPACHTHQYRYCEHGETGTTGASYGKPSDFRLSFTKWVDIHENVDITKNVDVRTHVFGNLGLANATADAYGPNTVSETITEYARDGRGLDQAPLPNQCLRRTVLITQSRDRQDGLNLCRQFRRVLRKFGFPVTYPAVHGPGARTAMRRVSP